MKRAAIPLTCKSKYLEAESAVTPTLLHFMFAHVGSIARKGMGCVAENSGGNGGGKSVGYPWWPDLGS
jgi:hypothetical protein